MPNCPKVRPCSLEPDKDHVKALLEGGLKIDALELIALWIIRQGIGRTRIVRIPQFDEYFGRGPFLRGFRPGNVNGPGIEVPGGHFAVGIDLADIENVTAVRAAPAALNTTSQSIGSTGFPACAGAG